MTYRENVNYLLNRERINTSQIQANTNEQISNIRNAEKTAISNIQKAEGILVGTDPTASFARGLGGQGNAGQGLIPWQFGRYVKDESVKGTQAAIDDRKDQLARLAKLQEHLELVKSQDTQMHEIKYKMLLNGAYYEDADRFTNLSPHAQVAYAQQKLNLYSETLENKLTYYMAKSEDHLDVNGVGYTPKSIHGLPLAPIALKEHALNTALETIRAQNGINGFSSEMLELAGITGTDGAEQKAKNNILGKYRNQYTIEASHNTRTKEFINFINNEDFDLNRLLTIYKGTYDENLNLLNYKGAWTSFEDIAIDALVRGDITETQLRKAFDVVNYDPAHKGKKFTETHEKRLESILLAAKEKKHGIIQKEIELAAMDANGVKAKFLSDINGGDPLMTELYKAGKLDDAHIQVYFKAWTDAGGQNNGQLPDFLEKIYTVQDADQDAIYEKAKSILSTRKWLTKWDIRNASFDTLNKIRQLPGYQMSSDAAKESLQQFKTGDGGWDKEITRAIKTAFGLTDLDEAPPNFAVYYNNTFAGYSEAYHDYLVNQNMTPLQAHNAALIHINRNWGHAVGGEPSPIKAEDSPYRTLSPWVDPNTTTGAGGSGEVQGYVDKIKALVKKTGDFGFLQEVSIIERDSAQHKMLIAYRDGKSLQIPKILIGINRHFDQFTVEDLINSQLIALEGPEGGLRSYSAVDAALKVPGLEELRRRLLLHPTSSSKVQSKLDAMDGENNFQVNEETGDTDDTDDTDKPETLDELYNQEILSEVTGNKEEGTGNIVAEPGTVTTAPNGKTYIFFSNGWGEAKGVEGGNEVKFYDLALDSRPPEATAWLNAQDKENMSATEFFGTNEFGDQGDGEDTTNIENTDTNEIENIDTSEIDEKHNVEEALIEFNKYIPLSQLSEQYPNGVQREHIEWDSFSNSWKLKTLTTDTLDTEDTAVLDDKVSYLESIYNLPGSPVLSPFLQGYSGELIAMNTPSNQVAGSFEEAIELDKTQGTNFNTWDYIVEKAKAAGAKYPELVAAQYMLESGRGKHQSGVNNYFNLKTTINDDHTFMETEEWSEELNKYVLEPAYFKNFNSLDQSINYLVRLWYKDFGDFKGLNNASSIEEAASQLYKENYSTEKEYAPRLLELIKEFKNRPVTAELAMA